MKPDQGMENLLEMNGWIFQQEGGYWVRFEAWKVAPSEHIPHGIRYNLTLHDHHNQRIMGFDNAHVPKAGRKHGYKGRIVEYDHQHTDMNCKGIPYSFESPAQLIEDFWKAVDDCLKKHGVIA
jgi:hypothetical protein